MQQIIMFNGPPRAGKDTAGQVCKKLLGADVELVKFTNTLKREAHKRLGLNCPAEAYEVLKDVPLDQFNGKTPRQFYTETSDDLKKKNGPHYIAEMLIKEIQKLNAPFIVNTDVGYDYEAQYLENYFGSENTTLVRIQRPGKSFQEDCRDWVFLPNSNTIEINNVEQGSLNQPIKTLVENIQEALSLSTCLAYN